MIRVERLAASQLWYLNRIVGKPTAFVDTKTPISYTRSKEPNKRKISNAVHSGGTFRIMISQDDEGGGPSQSKGGLSINDFNYYRLINSDAFIKLSYPKIIIFWLSG